ncbi:MAG: hypothetical protein N3F03_08740 [Ignavibacteria bacterium]|nr:hypothetical protein [Ignavibacteria bacterium]
MKNRLLIWVFVLIGTYFFAGCYTQVKLEDDDYAYKKERKRVIIEKRTEKDGETQYERVDTTYESTDDYAYDEDDDRYYYPRHRRAYKYYHPGITIVVGGAVYYDPWYFDYFYYPYPYVVCRTYYLPWWYGYYSCYRVWYGFVYYDPVYNPFWTPPYWWYDPYWYGGYYPPIYQYRKNDYTRLRDQDGGRLGSVRTGNWGRDLNLQVASERSRLRDGGRTGEVDRSTRPTSIDRERIGTDRDASRTPTLRDRSGTRDRETIRTPDRTREPNVDRSRDANRNTDRSREPNINRDRREERRQPPSDRRLPDRTPNRDTDRNRENPDRRETPQRRQSESFIPNLEQRILIERENPTNQRFNETTPQRNSGERVRIYREERPRIEYEIPRREYQPRFDNSTIRSESSNSSVEEFPSRSNRSTYERQRVEPRYEAPRYETPRYEAPRYETPRYETPPRNSAPSYSPPSRTSAPPVYQSPRNDRGRDQ